MLVRDIIATAIALSPIRHQAINWTSANFIVN